MRSRLASHILKSAVRQQAHRIWLGRAPFVGASLQIYARSTTLYRLPVRPWTLALQNAAGQFYQLDGYSHPNGGDVPR